MFTDADRLRAIELYFKYGKKLAPVVRELGYPSKRNLRRWICLWEASDGATEPYAVNPITLMCKSRLLSDVYQQDYRLSLL